VVDADALVAFAAASLGRHQLPRRVAVVDELPRTETGKLLRRQVLADLLADQPVTEGSG
jgi:long-chain acyl-CoA synthetase